MPWPDVLLAEGILDSTIREIAMSIRESPAARTFTDCDRTNADTRTKSPAAAPDSAHMRRKNVVASACTFEKLRKKGLNVVEVESAHIHPVSECKSRCATCSQPLPAYIAQCSESSSTTSLDALPIGHLRSAGRQFCSMTTCSICI
jgi:hypothetical protein